MKFDFKFCKIVFSKSNAIVDFLLNSVLLSENVSTYGFLSAEQEFLLIF